MTSAPSTHEAHNEAPPPHDLGVLFVHGIGEQDRGSTLVAFGEPLYNWLQRWFDGIARSWRPAGLYHAQQLDWLNRHATTWKDRGEGAELPTRFETLRSLMPFMQPGGDLGALPRLEEVRNDVAQGILAARVTVRDAQVRTATNGAPSHAPIHLEAIATDGTVHESRWVMAESWWAQTFSEPTFRQIALWLIAIVPWTLGSHIGARVRRSVRTSQTQSGRLTRVGAALGVAANMLLLVLSLPLAVFAELLVAALLLLALLPIPKIRTLLLAIERLLAQTLGDSLVLVASPLQQAAMIAQVQRDVAWLSARCRTVAVVAHSQGAAVAHRALRHRRPPEVKLLLTFGSGLRKLEEIEDVAKTNDGFFGPAYLSIATVALIGYSAVSALVLDTGWAPWSAGVGVLLFAFVVTTYLWRHHTLDIGWFGWQFNMQGLWWVDYHASADPVPNGSLQDYDPTLQVPTSFRICNERSFVADHTTYWQNTEEFVGSVAWWLTRLVPGPWHAMVDSPPAVFMPPAVRRRWRVAALVFGRWTGFAAAATLIIAKRGEWSVVFLWLWSRATALLGAIGPGTMSEPLAARPTTAVWAATLGALLALYALSRAARAVWDRWSAQELRFYFDRRPTPDAAVPVPSWYSHYSPASPALESFQAAWFYFGFVSGEVLVVVAFVPALANGWTAGWWSAGSIMSAVGLVAAVAYMWALNGAMARGVDRATTAAAKAPAAAA